jgi:transposase-like protein
MDSPKTLQEAIQFFSDFDNCRHFMAAVRWPDGVIKCPTCLSDKVIYLEKARLYKCRKIHPQQKFSLKVGTVFEDSPIPLQKWLPALWLLVACKNGVSSYEIHRALGVTQKTAWFMLHRIRLAMKTDAFGNLHKLGGEGFGPVEVDETFVGGQLKNMHRERRARFAAESGHTGGATGKTVVMGMLDRELRQVRAKVVPNVKRETLQREVLNNVRYGSQVYTDDALAYDDLRSRFVHDVVNHAERYVDGQVHTNGIENFWSLLKRSLSGTYIAVEPFHLDRYLDEQIFRFNNRTTRDNPLNDGDRFMLALSQIVGKRLTYAEVTGKVGETPF